MKWLQCYTWIFVPVICSVICLMNVEVRAEISAVLDKDGKTRLQDYVQIVNQPTKVAHNTEVTVEYHCSQPSIVGVDVWVTTATRDQALVFQRIWRCDQDSPSKKTIAIHLPNNIAFKPSFLNKHSINIEHSVIKSWVLDEKLWQYTGIRLAYTVAGAKVSHNVQIPKPYERGPRVFSICLSWPLRLSIQLSDPYSPVCEVEPEVYHAVVYPVALSGFQYGVHRIPPTYKNKVLEHERQLYKNHANPRFTIVIWLYIVSYCPIGSHLCSIVQHLTWNDHYMTPLIYINRQGKLHIQFVTKEGKSFAMLTSFPMPKEQWCRLVATFDNLDWLVTVDYGKNFEERHVTTFHAEHRVLWFDDIQGLLVFGGTELTASFKGYIGKADLYRHQAVHVDDIVFPSPYHPMFMLGLSDRDKKCSDLLHWVTFRVIQCKQILQAIIDRKSCSNRWQHVLKADLPIGRLTPGRDQCPLYGGSRPAQYIPLDRVLRRWVVEQRQFEPEELAGILYNNATAALEEEGFSSIPTIIPLLKQASCYGNHDATFMVSAILNNGIGVKVDEIQAQSYLMYGALDNNRLCLMALGNKHMYGLDDVPYDLEQAYVYFKNVADKTRQDKEIHKETDLMTETVRLTDEKSMDMQTDEDGDLYNWFKHQASQGVVSAQREMARLLYWGAQGIKRNMAAAVDYYRQGAESNDPSAAYDYGLVLLKGKGTQKNLTEAVKHLGKAADMGNPQAINTLGWHALEVERNNTKAFELFMKSYQRRNADAAHNLGHMYYTGLVPGQGPDREGAFRFFSFGALSGQIDSAVMVAMYNIRGNPSLLRNPKLAAEWARFVSEKNPAIGGILATALKAYRKGNWPLAVVYYMLAASTGMEVASFNLAYLCEENVDGMTAYMEKECMWTYFNISTQRDHNLVDTYSWIKMGDCHWYGCRGKRDAQQAAQMYANAARRGDPHALFNLAFMIEDGATINSKIWDQIRLPVPERQSNVTILQGLYSRCKESRNSEAYVPCSLALFRLQLYHVWQKYTVLVKLSSALGVMITLSVTLTSFYSHIRRNHLNVNTV